MLKSLGAEERRKRFDLDGNGVFDDRDGEILQRYLSSFNYLKLREREVKSRFEKRIDRNGDGILSKDEQIEAFHVLFEPILLLPHDPEKIRAAAIERLEDMEEGQAVLEGTVTEQKAVSSEVEGRRVAVVSLETMTGAVDDETVDGLLLFIENAFVNTRRVKVVERNNIESIVEEFEFQRTSMTEESTAVEIGKLANAELIVTGAVTFVGESYYLNIKLIDVESGEIAGSSLAGADGEEGFLEMCNTAVEALFPG